MRTSLFISLWLYVANGQQFHTADEPVTVQGVNVKWRGITVKEYREAKTSPDPNRRAWLQTYIEGMADGIEWTAAHGGNVYCQPWNYLTDDHYFKLIDAAIADEEARRPGAEINKAKIGALLIAHLQRLFPCPSK